MIVRISNEGQYRLDDGLHGAPQRARRRRRRRPSSRGDEDAFHAAFEELLQVVRAEGEELEDDDLDASDVILPPSDLSFVEAGEEFTGDGLIPEPA